MDGPQCDERLAYLKKPSSFTPALGAAGPSENTSTNRLPVLGAADPVAAAGRRPSRSADGEGVDWRGNTMGERRVREGRDL